MHGSGSFSGYANAPTKSTQTATKILQHLEKPDSKEKVQAQLNHCETELDMLHGQALRSLKNVDSPKLLSYPHDNQKSEVQQHDARRIGVFGSVAKPNYAVSWLSDSTASNIFKENRQVKRLYFVLFKYRSRSKKALKELRKKIHPFDD
ncbi:hypothetical protein Tco_0956610 [Tanacetum coccineum]